MGTMEGQVLKFIANSASKVNFGALKQFFCKTDAKQTKLLKRAIAKLIQKGELNYTAHFGGSFIELSYDHPRLVSDHVVLKSPQCSYKATANQRVVLLQRGAAFGGGDHPTTRLAVHLIDTFFSAPSWRKERRSYTAVDIGTGSGVLAIVAALMGIDFVIGIDTDPCAVFEARGNVYINQLEHQIDVRDDDWNQVDGMVDFVFANLRTPTLMNFRDTLDKKLQTDSVLIFSGIKSTEMQSVYDFYRKIGFTMLQNRSEMGWSAFCLARGRYLAAWRVASQDH